MTLRAGATGAGIGRSCAPDLRGAAWGLGAATHCAAAAAAVPAQARTITNRRRPVSRIRATFRLSPSFDPLDTEFPNPCQRQFGKERARLAQDRDQNDA